MIYIRHILSILLILSNILFIISNRQLIDWLEMDSYDEIYKSSLQLISSSTSSISSISSKPFLSDDSLDSIRQGMSRHNPHSLYLYGLIKLYGISTSSTMISKDSASAIQYFQQAANLNHPEATTAIGMCYMLGNGIEKNSFEAMKYFKKAIELNDPNAYWLQGKMLLATQLNSNKSLNEFSEAIQLLSKAANEYHIMQAEHFMGLLYEYGLGVKQDFHIASEYYQRASEKYFIESIYNLAVMFAYGRISNETRIFQQNHQRAISLFETNAQLNHAPSIYYLGLYKYHGYGTIKRDYQQAVHYFERAHSLDDPRVSSKALQLANDIQLLIDKAYHQKQQIIEKYSQHS